MKNTIVESTYGRFWVALFLSATRGASLEWLGEGFKNGDQKKDIEKSGRRVLLKDQSRVTYRYQSDAGSEKHIVMVVNGS